MLVEQQNHEELIIHLPNVHLFRNNVIEEKESQNSDSEVQNSDSEDKNSDSDIEEIEYLSIIAESRRIAEENNRRIESENFRRATLENFDDEINKKFNTKLDFSHKNKYKEDINYQRCYNLCRKNKCIICLQSVSFRSQIWKCKKCKKIVHLDCLLKWCSANQKKQSKCFWCDYSF